MPGFWTGTQEDRLKRLDSSGRRCDGNTRNCPRPAVEEYDLWEADGFGKKVPDSNLVTKKSCSYHRKQFIETGRYVVAANREIAKKDPAAGRRHAAAHARFSASLAPDAPRPTWLDFIRECNGVEDGIFGAPTDSGDWRTGGSFEEYADARVLRRDDNSVSIVARTERGNRVMVEAGRRLGIVVHV